MNTLKGTFEKPKNKLKTFATAWLVAWLLSLSGCWKWKTVDGVDWSMYNAASQGENARGWNIDIQSFEDYQNQ